MSRAWVVALLNSRQIQRARIEGCKAPITPSIWGAGRSATSPKCRPEDPPRPSSCHLSQIARQVSLVSVGAAHRTPNTHVPFASFRIEWTSDARGAPECRAVGGCRWLSCEPPCLLRSGTCAWLCGHGMDGGDASRLYLRSDAASGVIPLALAWPPGHVHSASRRPPHEHTVQCEKSVH